MLSTLLFAAWLAGGPVSPRTAGLPKTDPEWGGSDTWAFNPGSDDFKPTALLDLRYLNEKVAGESGFITADSEGRFHKGDGKPVRFWAVNTGVGRNKNFTPSPLGRQVAPDLDRHARFLAKRGVNMVRYHGQLSPDLGKNPDAKITDVNADERDWAWRLVAAMKKQGIYTTLSPYWMVPMKFAKSWTLPGSADQSAAALLFFDPTLKTAYKAWLKALLVEPNPYTGVPLAKDPALAIIELQNEDSMLFWTINSVKGEQKKNLEKLYGSWLLHKYHSAATIDEAWQGQHLPDDSAGGQAYDFYNIWDATQPQSGAKAVRLGDQIQFYTETMRNFNGEMVSYLRNDLGCKQLVNAGNWRTADTIRLNDAERYSYTSTQVDAVNKYFDGVHKGPNNGWAIQNGDQFTSPSALLDPRPLPTNLRQTKGRPILVTESSWVMPMAYSTESPFLISSYQSLTGVGPYYWFATGDDEWSQPKSANGYMPSQEKWIFGTPDVLGTFPAAALAYRMDYVKKGRPAVVEERAIADIWSRKTPLIAEEPSFDPNRDAGDLPATSSVKTGVDPLAFLVGPVQVDFGGDPAQSKVIDLSNYIDKSNRIVRSDTGELSLDYGRGSCVLNSPCAQGVTAFFSSAPSAKTSDATFASTNDYGAAMAVSMDGKPIKSSKKILIQYGTRSRPTGWQEKPATIALDGGKSVSGEELVNYGKAPWQVEKAKLTIEIANPTIHKLTELDMNGNAIRPVPFKRTSAGIHFQFPDSAMYVIAE